MNQTRSDPDLRESMWRTLKLISRIANTSGWRLVNHETYGWSFKNERGDYYDGQEDDLDAKWVALEMSTDPRDIELVKQIRERLRLRRAPEGGNVQ